MGFPTLIFYIYLIAIPIGLVLLGLWLLRYLSQLSYAQEKRILFTVIVIACLTFIAFSMGMKLNKWRQPIPEPAIQSPQKTPASNPIQNGTKEIRVPNEPSAPPVSSLVIGSNEAAIQAPPRAMTQEERLELFEAKNYPDLYEQRMGLINEIENQRKFLKKMEQLSNHTPKQLGLLQNIYRIRKGSYNKLQERNVTVSQHLRDFWVHYNTGNSHDATTKFNAVASKLTKKIKETRAILLDSKRKEASAISDHMRKAGLALKKNKIPKHQAGKITSYTTENRAIVLDWLTNNEHSRALEVLERLKQQRLIIRDRFNQVKDFRKRYPDLQTRLNRTLGLWSKAQESNYFAEYRLLYAAEARFIVDYLELSAGKAADKRLDGELSAYTEFVAGHAEDALEKAEQAYKPGKLR